MTDLPATAGLQVHQWKKELPMPRARSYGVTITYRQDAEAEIVFCPNFPA